MIYWIILMIYVVHHKEVITSPRGHRRAIMPFIRMNKTPFSGYSYCSNQPFNLSNMINILCLCWSVSLSVAQLCFLLVSKFWPFSSAWNLILDGQIVISSYQMQHVKWTKHLRHALNAASHGEGPLGLWCWFLRQSFAESSGIDQHFPSWRHHFFPWFSYLLLVNISQKIWLMKKTHIPIMVSGVH